MNSFNEYNFFILSGMSGAGKSTALNALEDLGFEALDNLPLEFIIRASKGINKIKRLVCGIDTRTRDFNVSLLVKTINNLAKQNGLKTGIIFLDSNDEVLIQRYKETRRPHPLGINTTLSAGIEAERTLLEPLKDVATIYLDTSALKPIELKIQLRKMLSISNENIMIINLISFGYRNGIPKESDLVLDVRFLKNPHYMQELQKYTGLEEKVKVYIKRDPDYFFFLENIKKFLSRLIPRYKLEGKTYLTLSIGCTGGRHRSVCVVEDLSKWFMLPKEQITVLHRDIDSLF